MKITVIGGGAWGTALAIAFAHRHAVNLWVRNGADGAALTRDRENIRYLPGAVFPQGLTVTSSVASLKDAELALIATPLSGLRPSLQLLAEQAPALPFLWACKGLEAGTGLLPHQIAREVGCTAPYGALTGPSFAKEVAEGLPGAVTLASEDGGFVRDLVRKLNGGNLRLYANDDLVGAEVGGAVKNVLAIASGISDGLGLGLNARAALLTRGLAEITRLGIALGGRRETFMGLTGMGDLILTCTGELSRNRRVGLALAGGQALEVITAQLGHVAEGVLTAREVLRRAEACGVDMPITRSVCAVLDGSLGPREAVGQLMGRDPRDE